MPGLNLKASYFPLILQMNASSLRSDYTYKLALNRQTVVDSLDEKRSPMKLIPLEPFSRALLACVYRYINSFTPKCDSFFFKCKNNMCLANFTLFMLTPCEHGICFIRQNPCKRH